MKYTLNIQYSLLCIILHSVRYRFHTSCLTQCYLNVHPTQGFLYIYMKLYICFRHKEQILHIFCICFCSFVTWEEISEGCQVEQLFGTRIIESGKCCYILKMSTVVQEISKHAFAFLAAGNTGNEFISVIF